VLLPSAGTPENVDGTGLSTPLLSRVCVKGPIVRRRRAFASRIPCHMHTRTPIHCIIYTSVVWLFPIVSVEFFFSVYIAVLWWQCMSHRVWQVSLRRYIFTWIVVLRGIFARRRSEAGQGSCSIDQRTSSRAVCRSLHGTRSSQTPSSVYYDAISATKSRSQHTRSPSATLLFNLLHGCPRSDSH